MWQLTIKSSIVSISGKKLSISTSFKSWNLLVSLFFKPPLDKTRYSSLSSEMCRQSTRKVVLFCVDAMTESTVLVAAGDVPQTTIFCNRVLTWSGMCGRTGTGLAANARITTDRVWGILWKSVGWMMKWCTQIYDPQLFLWGGSRSYGPNTRTHCFFNKYVFRDLCDSTVLSGLLVENVHTKIYVCFLT